MEEYHNLWAIWFDQPEHPSKYVVRRYELPVRPDFQPELIGVADDLDQARSKLPPGLRKAERNEREDPALVEMWMATPWSPDSFAWAEDGR